VLNLMNSAMMPDEGTYTLRKITPANAISMLQSAGKAWKSFIGYANTAAYLKKILGVEIPLSRDETHFRDGDTALICKLKYRPTDVKMKATALGQAEVKDEDFELYEVKFQGVF